MSCAMSKTQTWIHTEIAVEPRKEPWKKLVENPGFKPQQWLLAAAKIQHQLQHRLSFCAASFDSVGKTATTTTLTRIQNTKDSGSRLGRHMWSQRNGYLCLQLASPGLEMWRAKRPLWGIAWTAVAISQWHKPVCCRGSAFTAGSGSSTRSSIASRKRLTASVMWPALPASRLSPPPVAPPTQAAPSAALQLARGRGRPGGYCWWGGRAAARRPCARSCCGPAPPRASTGGSTSRAWPTTSAGRTTRTPCASAASSAAWWPRSAAAAWSRATRRRCATRQCRAPCSRGSASATPLRRSRGRW